MEDSKKNKKQLVIKCSIVSAIFVIGLVGWFVLKSIHDGKNRADKNVNSTNYMVENKSDLEKKQTSENETTSKVEIETIDPSLDPFTADVAGTYVDKSFYMNIKLRTYENGAKRYVYHLDSEDKDYLSSSSVDFPENVMSDMLEKMELAGNMFIVSVTETEGERETTKTEQEKFEMSIENDKKYWEESKGTVYTDSELYKQKVQWIRDNFGDTVTCDNVTYTYDPEYSEYTTHNLKDKIHVMTSPSTSKVDNLYYVVRYSRLADYLGYYGTSFGAYKNPKALMAPFTNDFGVLRSADPGFISKNRVYLEKLGWKKPTATEEGFPDWEYDTPEGIPTGIDNDGYIYIRILYSQESEIKFCKFTIEEYNQFVATHTWSVRSYVKSVGWAGEELTDRVVKYIYVE